MRKQIAVSLSFVLQRVAEACLVDRHKDEIALPSKIKLGHSSGLPPRGEMDKAVLQIYSGAAQVAPYRKGAVTACDQCDYRSICRLDPWTHRYRVLRNAPRRR